MNTNTREYRTRKGIKRRKVRVFKHWNRRVLILMKNRGKSRGMDRICERNYLEYCESCLKKIKELGEYS